MKPITVTLEILSNGLARATVRINGRTVSWKDGPPANAKALLDDVMSSSCSAHRLGSSYDLTHIELNPAAIAAYAAYA